MSYQTEYTAEELRLLAHKLLTCEDAREVTLITNSLTEQQLAEVTRYMDEFIERLI